MYKLFKSGKSHKDDSDVIINSKDEGLLGPFGNIMNIVPQLIGGITDDSSNIGRPNNYPSYIQNPGIPITKSNFSQMKQQLLSQRQLFWDSEFPANLIKMPSSKYSLEWKRPFEISQRPQLFTFDISRFDINQGKLGDCWLLAAMATLVLHKNLFEKVVPYDQSFNQGDYCGIFRFHIWYYGQWIEIVIDDLLPTVSGELMFMKSNDRNEFWSALLEKAYAKVYGSYENLKGGYTSEAMVDFTGGIIEKLLLNEGSIRRDPQQMDHIFFMMMHAFGNLSLMSCSKHGGYEERNVSGLVSRHAYSITSICLVNTMGMGQVRLIRLRNPWGNSTEWKGPWADGSQEWRHVPPQELQRLQIVNRNDGEFWMAFHDFVNQFDKMEVCYTHPQAMEEVGQMKNRDTSGKKDWDAKLFYGEWKRGINAGGSNKQGSFWSNPQFQLTILEPDTGSPDGKGTVIIGVMQRNLRRFNKDLLSIGFSLFYVQGGCSSLLPPGLLRSCPEVGNTGEYTNLREVSRRFRLLPGSYIIVPGTQDRNEERQFLVRIFSVKQTKASILDEKVTMETSKNPTSTPNQKVEDSNYNPNEINSLFARYSQPNMGMDSNNLMKVLNENFKKAKSHGSFSLTTCQAIIYMMKNDYNGRLDGGNFNHVWWYVIQWRDLFKKYDVNSDGTLDTLELRSSLSESGIHVNHFLFEKIVALYSENKKECYVKFDGYVRCCVQLKTIFDQYQTFCKTPQYASNKMPLEEFMDRSLQSLIQSG